MGALAVLRQDDERRIGEPELQIAVPLDHGARCRQFVATEALGHECAV